MCSVLFAVRFSACRVAIQSFDSVLVESGTLTRVRSIMLHFASLFCVCAWSLLWPALSSQYGALVTASAENGLGVRLSSLELAVGAAASELDAHLGLNAQVMGAASEAYEEELAYAKKTCWKQDGGCWKRETVRAPNLKCSKGYDENFVTKTGSQCGR